LNVQPLQIFLYNIPHVVIRENETFQGEEDLLRSRGVEAVVLDNEECKDLMRRFIQEKPQVRAIQEWWVILRMIYPP